MIIYMIKLKSFKVGRQLNIGNILIPYSFDGQA